MRKPNAQFTTPGFEVKNFHQVILPGQFFPGYSQTGLYNRTFDFWRKFWQNVYKNNGTSDQINEYDFLRAELVSVILTNAQGFEQIVGLHLYSILNFQKSNITSHPYLNGTDESCFVAEMKKRGLSSALTLEYLTVNEEFRTSKIGLSFAAVIGGLGFQLQKQLGLDAAFGRCRQDLGVSRLMGKFGGVTLKGGVMMHNTPTDFCATFLPDIKPHPEQAVCEVVEDLWMRRRDESGLTLSPGISQSRRAA